MSRGINAGNAFNGSVIWMMKVSKRKGASKRGANKSYCISK